MHTLSLPRGLKVKWSLLQQKVTLRQATGVDNIATIALNTDLETHWWSNKKKCILGAIQYFRWRPKFCLLNVRWLNGALHRQIK